MTEKPDPEKLRADKLERALRATWLAVVEHLGVDAQNNLRSSAEAHAKNALGVARPQGPVARSAEHLALSHAAELLERVKA